MGVENPRVFVSFFLFFFRASSFLTALQPFLSYNSRSDADILRVNNVSFSFGNTEQSS